MIPQYTGQRIFKIMKNKSDRFIKTHPLETKNFVKIRCKLGIIYINFNFGQIKLYPASGHYYLKIVDFRNGDANDWYVWDEWKFKSIRNKVALNVYIQYLKDIFNLDYNQTTNSFSFNGN